uniref:Protein kinase domain-containing protein n=1 Tax=Rhabditophanes sp. KR3021 TaxID=114890 RepID=A0AC35UES6_9BILA
MIGRESSSTGALTILSQCHQSIKRDLGIYGGESVVNLSLSEAGLSAWRNNEQESLPKASEDTWSAAVADLTIKKNFNQKVGLLIANRYQVLESIAKGKQGAVFFGLDLTLNVKVALKFDYDSGKACPLTQEHSIYNKLTTDKVEGIPRLIDFVYHCDTPVLITELMGPSLQQLLFYCDGKFGFESSVKLGLQMIDLLKGLHQSDLIHNDLKPENFVTSLDMTNQNVYIIDFGLTKNYKLQNTTKQNQHMPWKKTKAMIGTANYVSLNTHNGIEMSRRDDLESLGYMLMEFMVGSLPWKKSVLKNVHMNNQRIAELKFNFLKDVGGIGQFIRYCRNLQFDEAPDYDYLKSLLIQLKPFEGTIQDQTNLYTWTSKRNECADNENKFYLNFRWCAPSESFFDKQKETDFMIGTFGID